MYDDGVCINCHEVGNLCKCDEWEPIALECPTCNKPIQVPAGGKPDGGYCPHCGAGFWLEFK